MNLDAVAKRVSSLPPRLLDVLACLSEGMSNSQIAAELGYKNASSVATLSHEITKRLGLLDVHSRIEKRQLAAEAFRKATLRTVKIKLNKISGSGPYRSSGRLTHRHSNPALAWHAGTYSILPLRSIYVAIEHCGRRTLLFTYYIVPTGGGRRMRWFGGSC